MTWKSRIAALLLADVYKRQTLERPALRQLDHAAEALTAAQLERSFRTLDYYKSIFPTEVSTYE